MIPHIHKTLVGRIGGPAGGFDDDDQPIFPSQAPPGGFGAGSGVGGGVGFGASPFLGGGSGGGFGAPATSGVPLPAGFGFAAGASMGNSSPHLSLLLATWQ